MGLKFTAEHNVPKATAETARAAFPGGNIYMGLRDNLGDLYSDEDFSELFSSQGRPAESPGILALVSVLQIAEGFSDRQAADSVRARIDWKYLLNLELTDKGFDFTVLHDFRERLITGGDESKLLDILLEIFRERGLLKAGGSQRTDSTHVLAAVRNLNRLEVVGETLRFALNRLSVEAPEWLKSIVIPDWYQRYEARFEMYRLPKSEEKRKKLALTIGADGYYLLNTVCGEDSPEQVKHNESLEILRQVWIQQYTLDRDEVVWRNPKDMPPSERLIQSPYDTEARHSRKRNTEWTGYKVHITETFDRELHVITNVETVPATTQDNSVTDRIHTALAAKDLLPDRHVVDTGYVDAELMVESPRKYGIELVGPVLSDTGWQARAGKGFDVSAFKMDWTNRKAVCPQGVTSIGWNESFDSYRNSIVHIRFAKEECGMCPVRSDCTRAKSGGPRTLKVRTEEQHKMLQYARENQKTDAFKKNYGKRGGVEGTLSQCVRKCGMRSGRYAGVAKNHLQNLFTAVAINLARFFNWTEGIPHARTRKTAFASLAG